LTFCPRVTFRRLKIGKRSNLASRDFRPKSFFSSDDRTLQFPFVKYTFYFSCQCPAAYKTLTRLILYRRANAPRALPYTLQYQNSSLLLPDARYGDPSNQVIKFDPSPFFLHGDPVTPLFSDNTGPSKMSERYVPQPNDPFLFFLPQSPRCRICAHLLYL